MHLQIISDNAIKAQRLRQVLEPELSTETVLLPIAGKAPSLTNAMLVDVDLRRIDVIEDVRKMTSEQGTSRTKLFLVRDGSRLTVAQAFSLGASDVIFEPFDLKDLKRKLGLSGPAASTGEFEIKGIASAEAVGAVALASMFSAVQAGRPIVLGDAETSTDATIDAISKGGLTTWLADVRRHHEGTFQHCLLVTGIAIDFGLCLGFINADVKRLGLAATLHDVGKGAIPLEILDKRGALNDSERAIINKHPIIGYDALRASQGFSADVMDAVCHHHEYLDGSGYPHGLSGGQISDLVRILTISDIFAALIEARSYKAPMDRHSAYEVLCRMEGKLERPLVRAFEVVALNR